MKEKISISIDKELLKKIRKLAKEDNRTLSNFIERILMDVKEYM